MINNNIIINLFENSYDSIENKTDKMASTSAIDTISYDCFPVLLPGNPEGFKFTTVGKTMQPPTITVEYVKETDIYYYALKFIDETGAMQCYYFTSVRPSLDDTEGDIVYEKQPGLKCSVFQGWSLRGGIILDNEERDKNVRYSPKTKFMPREGMRVLEPAPEHQGRCITIMTCFTNLNHFGTRHMAQRIYFFVDGVKYPFATLDLCCNHSKY